jgi:hypothetical protein
MMSKREVIRAMHKTTSNKTLEINNIINYVLRHLICIDLILSKISI